MPSLLITFAVKEEACFFNPLTGSRPEVPVLITGMGARNSERRVLEAFSGTLPGQVITCGFAGGLNPELRTGAVLYSADENFPSIGALTASGARPGTFHCATRVAVTVAEKKSLREQTGADAVEMESGVIRALCRDRGIPSATVRVISDPADEELPLDFNKLMDTEQNLSLGRLALAVLTAPWKIRGLIRLRNHTRLAAGNLARALAAITAVRPPGA